MVMKQICLKPIKAALPEKEPQFCLHHRCRGSCSHDHSRDHAVTETHTAVFNSCPTCLHLCLWA